MSGIFISYRREDSTAYARLLSDTLADHFGSRLVFRDVDTMGPGVDFPTAIAEAVNECDVLLALIGEKWLTAEQDGRRRLDDENDYVRLEIAAALERGILVVPVLLEGTRMPSRAELPDALAKLANRNAHRLTDESWSYGVDRLVTALRKVVAPPPPPPPEAAPEVAPEVSRGAPPARPTRARPLRARRPAPPSEPPPAEPAAADRARSEPPAADGAPSETPVAEPAPADRAPAEPAPAEPTPVDRRRRVAILSAVGVVLLLALIGLAVGLAGGGGGGETATDLSTESTEATQETAADVEPRLDISPGVVTAGETVTMRGEGFQPNEKVVILYSDQQIYEFVADANGRFWETDDVPELESGTYDFQAKGTESGRTADASVEVA